VSTAPPLQIHATCVARDGIGVLLRGASGSGKSDLAFRLLERGFRLVADDRVDLRRRDGALLASAPAALGGLIELRGLGIVAVDRDQRAAHARLALAVDLMPREAVERLPDPDFAGYLGVAIARVALDAFDASAPGKVALALRAAVAASAMAQLGKPAA
jgi:serine kinase of HPr protein (carbohydrate metabolism regulator)